jgi:Protein of unknown function (DUF3014)
MKPSTVWSVALVLLGLIVGGLYWWQLESRVVPPNPPVASAASAPAVAAVPSAPPPSIPEPPATAAVPAQAAATPPSTLAESLSETFGDKALLRWLNADALAHRVAVTVDTLARPHSPARFWPVHPTPGRFTTQVTGNVEVIAAANAKRYAEFVAWVETLDAKAVVALYRRLYPQLQRAYEDLGYPGRSFNNRVLAVIDHLLETPSVAEPIEVKLANVKGPIQPPRPWVMVEFADEELEEKSSGQKLILRIGKDNAQRLKVKLRELRAALTQPR